jgi:hypothetical protein
MKRWLEVSILLLQNTHRACRSESKLRRNTFALLAESEKPWYTLKQHTAPAESNQINWNHYKSTRGYICTGSDHVMPLNRLVTFCFSFRHPGAYVLNSTDTSTMTGFSSVLNKLQLLLLNSASSSFVLREGLVL